MKRIFVIFLSLIMIISLVGCNESVEPDTPPVSEDGTIVDSSPSAIRMILSSLPDKGYTIVDIRTEKVDEDRFIHKVEQYYIIDLENGDSVYVYVFGSEEKAQEHAECYNEDGSGYNAPNISVIIDYIAPVRMWRYEECVIEYAQDQNELYLPLCRLFGTPFVGKTDILEIIKTSDIQYIRTDHQGGEFVNNSVTMIKSANELAEYYEANKEIFDLERKDVVYSDTTVGFLDAVDTYSAEWFETHDLVLVVLGEGSGSIRHKITSVTIRNYDLETFIEEDFAMQINVQKLVPEAGTCDEAVWHVMIGLPKRDYPANIGVGMNELWDTDFGWMMEETTSETDAEEQSLTYFPCGMLAVQVDGLWGYIDRSGEFVIKPQYDAAMPFASNGLACICINDEFGYINAKGEIVIEPQYDLAYDFEECGLATVYVDKKFGFINGEGEYVFEPTFSWVSGAYDASGTFSKQGIACVRLGDYPDAKFAFVDANGNYVTEPIFDSARSFADNGLAAVKVDGMWGYINTNGEFVIEPKTYSQVGDFMSNGLALVCTGPGGYGYIDESGEYVIEPKLLDAGDFDENGLAIVKELKMTDRGYGVIDSKGSYVIEPKFDFDFIFSFADNGLAVAKVNGKAGYINMEGEFVIEPIFYSAGDFVNGLARVSDAAGTGYINERGEYVIEPREDIYYAYPFDDDGYAVIRGDENWTVINRSGETVFGPCDWINCNSELWFKRNYESVFEPE